MLSTPPTMGWEMWGPGRREERGWVPRGSHPMSATTGHWRTTDKGPTQVPLSTQQNLLETACSVREEVVEHRKGVGGNLPSRLFPVPAAHLASLEPWDGDSHHWPEPRACLGHLGSWRLIKLGKCRLERPGEGK